MGHRIVRTGCLLLGCLAFFACAPKQRVPLDLGPAPVELFVDGERAEELPPELELRSDRDHKIFVKRPGYIPELVVLEAREVDGRDGLVPDRVHVRLQPVVGDREIRIEDAAVDSGE